MSRQTYVHPDDAQIERVTVLGVNTARVFDNEGFWILDLPGSLSDAEVKAVIKTVNNIYNTGYEQGQLRRGREIACLLGVKPEALA
ncbi:hypothetical protein [Franconibacter helveticus]|uniref:hypothetical protein n=1 Tax=Franconibacter helveticus TaxID=357240 RepID=UPI000DA11694|nr:hypothetical protein [Franconibacter helveticus]